MTEFPIGVTGETSVAGTAPAVVETPTTQDTSLASEQTAGSATAGDVQGATESDPLAGVPSLDELNQLPDETQYKKSLIQLRSAYESVKPQLSELTEKFKPFESFADRFEKPEELQELVDLKEKLFGYERDGQNQLIPSTQGAAQYLAEKYPQHADFLTADLLDQPTLDPDTGRTVPRIELALEAMKDDPARRAKALQILGGVEPTSIAPTWQPSTEELSAILRDPERPTPEEQALQDVYKKLPYEERESLKLNDPDFIRNYLKKEQFQQNLMAENQKAQDLQTQQAQQRERYLQQQASEAGNKYVEENFRQGFTEFANSIVERAKFITPLDPASPEAQGMPPDQVTQMNTQIQQINTGIGKMIATVTAALSHPDTQWVAAEFLTSLGVEPKVIQAFDSARTEFARNARDYGELNFRESLGRQNGNGVHPGLGNLQSNASRAMRDMKARGNLVAQPLLQLMSKFFEMKAGSYNSTLNGAATARPPITGTAFDPTSAATQRQPVDPSAIYNKEDIERMAYK